MKAFLLLQFLLLIIIITDIILAVTESWQSGNAADSKSAEPAITGAQVQILYSPF